MRTFFGMILGIALTVGVAFMHDTWTSGPSAADTPAAADRRAMVNWDVVGNNLRRVHQHARDAWTTLSHKINS